MTDPLARGKRLRLVVDIDVSVSVSFDHAARTVCIVAGQALKDLHPGYRLHGFAVYPYNNAHPIARFTGTGDRIDVDTGELGA